MITLMKNIKFTRLFILLGMILIAGCSPTDHNDGDSNHSNMDMNHNNSDDHSHDDEHFEEDRTPNNGSTIELLSPVEGQVFEPGEDIVISISATDFELSANAGHWHLYIDNVSEGMVTHGKTEVTLDELPAGTHKISAFLTQFTHVELEDGASVTITINP